MPRLFSWFSQHARDAFFAWAFAFVACALLTPLVILVAQRAGLVAKPRADRWHSKPTALYGGVAIFVACAVTLGASPLRGQLSNEFSGALWGAAFMFVVGVLDDARPFKPLHKFGLQLLAAVGFGAWFYGHEHKPEIAILIPFAIIWVTGVTNALNLLDNMDGLSSGVAMICAFFLSAHAALNGDTLLAFLSLGVSGACAGFLLWNFNPAKIFMGDGGSLFLGYTLACLSLMGRHGLLSGNFFSALVLPALVLATPVFDTLFVSLARLGAGRSPAQGGRDHTSHRLVLLGLSERRAVLWLYGITLWFGLVSLWGASTGQLLATFAASAASALALLVFGGFLAEAQAYSQDELDRGAQRAMVTRGKQLRPLAKIGGDFALCASCLIAAYLLKYDGDLTRGRGDELARLLPLVVLCQVAALFLSGSYKRTWRDASFADVGALARGVLLGTLAAYVFSRVLPNTPRALASLFAFDAALLLLGAGALRVGTKALRHHFAGKYNEPRA